MIDGGEGTASNGIIGSYDVRKGSKPDRSGTARIEPDEDALKITWVFKDGEGGRQEGYGFEVERGLIASRRRDSSISGVVIYRRDAASGRRSASWYMKGFPSRGTGTLTGGPDQGWAGKFRVHYVLDKDPKGKGFWFDLLIDRSGDAFRLEWWPLVGEDGPREAREGPQFAGVGLLMGDDLVAGWCATEGRYDDIQVVALASSTGGRILRGEGASHASTRLDREEMSKVVSD